MSFVSNGGKFKLYTVLNSLIFYGFHYGCFNYYKFAAGGVVRLDPKSIFLEKRRSFSGNPGGSAFHFQI
jgi:hypothetical protein